MSTVNEIFNADITESSYRHQKYWKSSTLPVRERIKNKPKNRKYPRDKVLLNLMHLEMSAAIKLIGSKVNK